VECLETFFNTWGSFTFRLHFFPLLSRYSRMSERVQHDEQRSSLHDRWRFRYDERCSSLHDRWRSRYDERCSSLHDRWRSRYDERCSSLHDRWRFRYDERCSSLHTEGLMYWHGQDEFNHFSLVVQLIAMWCSWLNYFVCVCVIHSFSCSPPHQVSRCCGLKITSEGYVVTLAKNNHHVLVLNTLYIM